MELLQFKRVLCLCGSGHQIIDQHSGEFRESAI